MLVSSMPFLFCMSFLDVAIGDGELRVEVLRRTKQILFQFLLVRQFQRISNSSTVKEICVRSSRCGSCCCRVYHLKVESGGIIPFIHTFIHLIYFHVCMCCRLHWWSSNTRCEGCVWFRVRFLALAMSMSSAHHPHCMPSTPEDVPGGATTITSKVLDTSAGLLQSLKPINNFQQVRYDASSSLIILLLLS